MILTHLCPKQNPGLYPFIHIILRQDNYRESLAQRGYLDLAIVWSDLDYLNEMHRNATRI